MRGRTPNLLARLIGIGFVAAACSEDDAIPRVVDEEDFGEFLAVEACADAFDCDCPDLRWDSRSECLEEQRLRRDDESLVAAGDGLTYDGECVVDLIERARVLECELVVAEDAPLQQREAATCPVPCKAYYGDKVEGEACSRLGVTVPVDDCGQGLRCEERVCVPMCDFSEPLPVGAKCLAGIEVVGKCEVGSFCDEASRNCLQAPVLGETCQTVCAPGAWCDRTPEPPVCVATLAEGDACVIGESCDSGVCEDQACTAPRALVCPA